MANADSILEGLEEWPGEELVPHPSVKGCTFLLKSKVC